MSSDLGKSNDSAWKVEEYVSIIIVCLIFLALSDCLGTFKRLLCGVFCDRNQVQRRRAAGESIPEDSSMQIQSLGLESSMVQSLPTFEFKKKEGEQEKAINVECAICLGEFEEGEWLKHLPHCSHSFHVSCIDTWFQSHSNCPLCRSFVHQHILQCSVLLQPLSREDIFQERAQSIRPQNLPISIRQQQPSSPP